MKGRRLFFHWRTVLLQPPIMSRSVNLDLREHLGALEAATKSDEVIWKVTDEPPLDENDFPDENRSRLNPRYLVTMYGGRRLVIAMVRDGVVVDGASQENAFYLASQHADGRLGRMLWPSYYSSNLDSEALDSMRRHRAPTAPLEP